MRFSAGWTGFAEWLELISIKSNIARKLWFNPRTEIRICNRLNEKADRQGADHLSAAMSKCKIGAHRLLFMVFLPRSNAFGAIELLQQDYPHQSMRESEVRKRYLFIRAGKHCLRKPV